MTTPAGWYDDGSGRQRWWDGTQWTEHVSGPATPAAPVADTASVADQPTLPIQDTASALPIQDTAATLPIHDAVQEPSFAPPFVLPSQTASWPPHDPATAGPTPGGAAYGYVYPAPTAPVRRPVSVLGLIGLALVVLGIVLSFIPAVRVAGWSTLGIGFVVSVISLFLRGARWPGITGLAATLPGVGLALAAALISMPLHSPPIAGGTPSSAPSSAPETTVPADEIEGAETVYIGDLVVGDCLPMIEWEEEVTDVTVVPCDQPHTDEVYLVTDLTGDTYPSDDEIQKQADDICLPAFEQFAGIGYDLSELDYYWFVPTQTSWMRFGDRKVQCIAFSYEDVVGTLKGAGY